MHRGRHTEMCTHRQIPCHSVVDFISPVSTDNRVGCTCFPPRNSYPFCIFLLFFKDVSHTLFHLRCRKFHRPHFEIGDPEWLGSWLKIPQLVTGRIWIGTQVLTSQELFHCSPQMRKKADSRGTRYCIDFITFSEKYCKWYNSRTWHKHDCFS